MNICVQCSNVRSCSANIRTREHGFKKKIKEHSNIDPNIRTFEHLNIGEHSNIEHVNVQKIAKIVEHSNTDVRCSVAPGYNSYPPVLEILFLDVTYRS